MTFEKLLKKAYQKVDQVHKEQEAAKLLLMELSGFNPHQFFMALKSEVPSEIEISFLKGLDAYIDQDIPVQHIIGHAYFYGYPFNVNHDVLIPRSETEQLCEHVIYYCDHYFDHDTLTMLDLGTGSGCIGITLDLEIPNSNVLISDISEKALDVAKANIKKLDSKATVILSDLFLEISGKFDVIVSNPPYIPEHEDVAQIVLKEPHVALYGGQTGIEFYERILKSARFYLNEKGLLAFEHGYQQKQMIHDLALKYFSDGTIIQMKDLQGKDRFTFIGIGGVLQ